MKKYLDLEALGSFLDKLRATFADMGHKHSFDDIDSGTVPIERGGTDATTAEGAFENIINPLPRLIDVEKAEPTSFFFPARGYLNEQNEPSAVVTFRTREIIDSGIAMMKQDDDRKMHFNDDKQHTPLQYAVTVDETGVPKLTDFHLMTGNMFPPQDDTPGVVKLSNDYSQALQDDACAFSQSGAANMYHDLGNDLRLVKSGLTDIQNKIDSGEIGGGGTDTMVTQTPTSENKVYPLLLAPDAQMEEVTGTAFFNAGVTLNPSTNTINANLCGSTEAIPAIKTSGTDSTGATVYAATVPGITELKQGMCLTIVPDTLNGVGATLNVNGLGNRIIRERIVGTSNGTTQTIKRNRFAAGIPVHLVYNGTFWYTDIGMPDMANAHGTLPVSSGGTGATAPDFARDNLGVYSKEEVDTKITDINTDLGDISTILETVTGVTS